MNDFDRRLHVTDEILGERLAEVRDVIGKLGKPDVEIVAVTKGFDGSAVDAAKRLGLSSVGENYAQELAEKAANFDGVEVNFLGRIQRNKVRKVCDLVDLWQSVARVEVLSEIAKRSPGAKVLVQIQPEGDDSKDGVRPSDLDEFFEIAEEHNVNIAGFMTIGVLGDLVGTSRCFHEVSALADEYSVAIRSMGMSSDYRVALDAGSTMLRLGSVLFGPRPTKPG